MLEVSGECSEDQHLWGREGSSIGQREMGQSPQRPMPTTGSCCSGDDLHSQVEVKELDLYILLAGCRQPSGKGHDLGLDGSLQPRAIPGQG